jgi:hypothetical protein
VVALVALQVPILALQVAEAGEAQVILGEFKTVAMPIGVEAVAGLLTVVTSQAVTVVLVWPLAAVVVVVEVAQI